MTDIQSPKLSATERNAYCGTGSRGWQIEWGAGHPSDELVAVDAGKVFGGEWPERQEWKILEGTGWLSCDSPPSRVRVGAGQRYRLEAGERRLLRADTALRVLITRLS
jgi:hypothetical protein